MSTAATDPQDRREQVDPVVSDQQREKTALNLLLAEEHDYPWSVEELVRMIGERLGLDTVDAVRRREAAGLLHRIGEFVFPTLATRRADDLGGRHVRKSGDGGNRTRVRGRVRMASTSVAGSLISSWARLAGRVAQDQPPEWSPDRRRRASPGEPAI